jgi:ATP-dependent Clp protease ATP-binding subunit ClpC
MPDREFTLTLIASALDDDFVLLQPLSLSGVSLLNTTGARIAPLMRNRVQTALRSVPASELHAQGGELDVRVTSAEVELTPPRRHPAWQQPVVARFSVVVWKHGSGMVIARAPALELTIIVDREERLAARLSDEIKFALQRNKTAMSLWRLALSQRFGDVTVEPFQVTAPVKSPRQAAEDEDKGEKPKSLLSEVAADLLKQTFAPAVEIEPVVKLLAETLGGRNPHSVLLVGASGVGKSAAFHELVRRRGDGCFDKTPFWATSGARLVAGMSGFGQWQERCAGLVREAAGTKAIVHLGNLAELLSVGKSTHNQQGIASFLRPHIARGELLCVVECTPEQLAVMEREEPHVLSALVHIHVAPADVQKTRRILEAVANRSGLAVSSDAVDEIVRLHARYASYSAFPGRPLRFLKNLLIDAGRGDSSAPLGKERGARAVTPGDVTAAFARETGLPLFMLDDAAPLDLDHVRNWFTSRVVGQPEPVNLLCDLLATVKARLARPRKPLASLLFIGPTGVGKTELAKCLARFLFGSEDRMVRFDMSEFADPLAAQRLIAGTQDGEGLLTARVREQPFCVLLLDEFEKADSAVFDLLLQVLGEGRLTDAAGRVADFSNAAIILTSNLGAQTFQVGAVGFASAREQRNAREHFVSEVRKFLRPEMFNRIDAVVPFALLDETTVLSIARREIDAIRRRDGIRNREVQLNISHEAVAHLARRGFDPRYGARPLKRAIERDLLVPLAGELNSYTEPDVQLTANVGVSASRGLSVTVRALPRSKAEKDSMAELFATSSCVQLRRRVQRMRASSAFAAIENNVTRLTALQKKLGAKAARQGQVATQLERLPKLEYLLQRTAELERSAIEFERDVLAQVYAKQEIEAGQIDQRLRPLRTQFDEVASAVYSAQFERPDLAVLCVFGENRPWVLRLAQAYWQFAHVEGATAGTRSVQMREIVASRAGRDGGVVLKDIAKPAEYFAQPRAETLGLILSIHAPLAWPRFLDEAGEHVHKTEKGEERAFVEVASTVFEDYRPPKGMERPGFKPYADLCRTFLEGRLQVKDAQCGTVPWEGSVTEMLERLLDRRLTMKIEAALDLAT